MYRLVALALLSCIACSSESDEMAQQDLTTQARGLWLTSNPLDAPPGSLSEATNAVIRRRGVVEPRRGQAPDATVPSSAYVDSMASFEGELILHTSEDALAKRDSSTTITAYSGTYVAPDGHPVRFAEASGGLYATTNAGPVRLDSPSSAWVAAGVPPGLEGRADAASGTSGWIDYGETVGYRLVWGRRDGDGQLMLGAPSGRILYSASSAAIAVDLSRAAATVTATTVDAHGLTTGDTIVLVSASSEADFPLGSFTITVTGANTFTYSQAGPATTGTGTYMEGTSTRDVEITAPIPEGVVQDETFLQIYRTVVTATGGADPGEDMAQVGEYFPRPDEIAAGFLTFTDIAPFANGPTGYFSPSLGIGISGAKEQPPLLTDATNFNGYLFGVVQAYRPFLEVSLLSASGSAGLSLNQGITFTDGTTTETYYCNSVAADEGTSPGPGFRIFYRPATGSVTTAQQLEQTMRSLVRVLNGYSALVTATYSSTVEDIPGKAVVTARDLGGDPIEARAYINRAAWNPLLVLDFVGQPTRVGTTVTVDTLANHALEAGEQVELLGGDADFPAGVKTIVSTPTVTTFTYTEAGAAVASGTVFDWQTTSDPVYLEQAATGSDYAFSDLEEPDAWPPRFRFKVGGPNVTLYRILPQGNALLFFTSEGLYRLTGRTADEFVLLPMDPTVKLIGKKTPVAMANRVFALTNEGVISVTDLGVENISDPIKSVLQPYYAGDIAFLTEEAAFGTGYESEHEYILWLQNPMGGSGDPPDRAYTYNTITNTWVGPWEFFWSGINPGNEVRSAHVHTGDGLLYLGAGSRLTRERKLFVLSDYQDTTGVGIPFDVATVVNTAKNPGAYKQWVEATVLLEKPQPASVELYFTTEIDDTEEGATITTQGNAAVRSYIPLDKSRSARLTVGLRHSTAEEKPTILGVQTIANVSSTRLGR